MDKKVSKKHKDRLTKSVFLIILPGAIFTGGRMPIGQADAKRIGVFRSKLPAQPLEFRRAIESMRQKLQMRDEGYAPLPYDIVIHTNCGATVHGSPHNSSVGVSSDGSVRIPMARWSARRLHWMIVQIDGDDNITISVYQNPLERTSSHTAFKPVIQSPHQLRKSLRFLAHQLRFHLRPPKGIC